VKKPDESKAKWDYYKLVKTIPAEDAWRPLEQGGCSLVGKKSKSMIRKSVKRFSEKIMRKQRAKAR
jgi:hypothetical protein